MKNHITSPLSSDQRQKNIHLTTLKNFVLKLFVKPSYCIAQFLSLLIQLLRPLLGPDKVCPFTIGCTQYAVMQLNEAPLKLAIPRIVKRLLHCNPFTNLFKKNRPLQ